MTEYILCTTDSDRRKIVPGLLHKTYNDIYEKSFRMSIVLRIEEYSDESAETLCISSSGTSRSGIVSALCDYQPR
jgi:hypothetical protein